MNRRVLEDTCGEAPFLVSRYDAADGREIEIRDRAGLLDRKLRVVSENAGSEEKWLKWAIRAFKATYGYEFQGDSLLIARINLLVTFEEYLKARWGREPTRQEYMAIIRIMMIQCSVVLAFFVAQTPKGFEDKSKKERHDIRASVMPPVIAAR